MPDTLNELLTVDEPHLIERYSRALSSFGTKMPELNGFRIDMIGFSPEIAAALGDEDYLDPNKVNRRFIILTPDQEKLSLIQQSFSNTRDLMLQFFEHNRRALYALTIKDVLFGEIEDSVFEVDNIDDLLAIEQVEFKIGTYENLTEKTADLKLKIDRLLKEPDAWLDDAMLSDMVALVQETGDIRENKLVPDEVVFRHDSYWTSHFGGTYIFEDDKHLTVICNPDAPGFRRSRPWQVSYLDIGDHDAVFRFLLETRRLQPPLGSWIERSNLLEWRRNLVAVWLAKENSGDLPDKFPDSIWLRNWVGENRRIVESNNVIRLIDWANKQARDWGDVDIIEVEDHLRFALCRAEPEHKDMALTNRLISEFVPFDFVSRFEFHRPLFNREKQNWTSDYLDFVVKALEDAYLNDRKTVFETLYF